MGAVGPPWPCSGMFQSPCSLLLVRAGFLPPHIVLTVTVCKSISSSTAESPCPACEASALLSPHCHFSAILGHVGVGGRMAPQAALSYFLCMNGEEVAVLIRKEKRNLVFYLFFYFQTLLSIQLFSPLTWRTWQGAELLLFPWSNSTFFLFCY